MTLSSNTTFLTRADESPGRKSRALDFLLLPREESREPWIFFSSREKKVASLGFSSPLARRKSRALDFLLLSREESRKLWIFFSSREKRVANLKVSSLSAYSESSGCLQPRSTARTPAQPLDQPVFLNIDQGATGQLLASIKPVRKAKSCELRYGPVGPGAHWRGRGGTR